MNPTDDPRFTAYADGALPPSDSVRFERELAADPAARAELERIRALQRGLREAFAEDSLKRAAPATAAAAFAKRPAVAREEPRRRAPRFSGWLGPLLAAACIAIISGAVLIPTTGKVRETARRSVDSSNLRQIGQACLIFASDHADRLPEATDVWDFARRLAIAGGLNDATVWIAGTETGAPENAGVSTVVGADRKTLEPAFARSRPSFAVVLSGLSSAAPATTPIAWTRGLRPDGTWAPDSPYGGDGGHVVFLGGNVMFFRKIGGAFVRYDGKGMTSDVLEALPPGARVGDATGPLPPGRAE